MLSWLGKQLLGQTDKAANQHTGAEGNAMEIIIRYDNADLLGQIEANDAR